MISNKNKKFISIYSRKKNHHHPHKLGVPGADDIVDWLFLQMNEKGITLKEMSEKTGVDLRTLNSWKAEDEARRKFPTLPAIVACMEYLGFPLTPTPPVVAITEDKHFFPYEHFQANLCALIIKQKAEKAGITEKEQIERDNKEYIVEIKEKLRTRRTRIM